MRETGAVTGSRLLHFLPLDHYRRAHDRIAPPTLDTEGFVHCSPDLMTTLAVANTRFTGSAEPMIAVELDAVALSAPVRWEAPDPAPPDGVAADVLFPHVYGPLELSAVTRIHYARRDLRGNYLDLLLRPDTAEEFDLLPHPEGGWYRRTWASPVPVRVGGSATRPTATAIQFLLTAGQSSDWHTVSSDELWFAHRGELTLWLGGPDSTTLDTEAESVRLGLGDRARPQAVVPAGTWQRAEADAGSEALISCVVSPGFDFADFAAL